MVNHVAGKDTAIFTQLSEAVEVDSSGMTQYLSVMQADKEIARVAPINSGESDLLVFQPKKLSDVNNWAAGDYTLRVNVNDSWAQCVATFKESKKIKVLAVPVVANYADNVVECEGEWKSSISFTEKVYPIAKGNIEFVLGNEVDLSSSDFDLTTDEGMYNVWEALCSLQTPNNDYELILGFVRNRQGESSNIQGYTYGSPVNIITESDGDMMPTVAHEIAHCYDVGDEYPGGTINNAVNPAPYGMEGMDWTDQPDTVSGNKQFVKSANEVGNENTGTLVSPEQRPYDPTEKTLLGNVGSYMGSNSPNVEDYWVTSAIWNHLYRAFVDPTAPVNFDSTGYATETPEEEATLSCYSCYESSPIDDFEFYYECYVCGDVTQVSSADEAEYTCGSCDETEEFDSEYLYLSCPICDELNLLSNWLESDNPESDADELTAKDDSSYMTLLGTPAVTSKLATDESKSNKTIAIDIIGSLSDTGVFTPSPWYSYEADPQDLIPSKNGDYAVYMYDANGKQVNSHKFSVATYSQSTPPTKLKVMPINVTARLPKNTAKIVIKQGEKELFSQSVSANTPTIEMAPISTDELSGKVDISWSGKDVDGDSLNYELWYCDAEDSFTNVASNISTEKYTVDFDKLPGSGEGYFCIYATDGVNTSYTFSDYIKVAYKAPEFLENPSNKKSEFTYKITDEITIELDIYDMQDGWMFLDEEVEWTDEKGTQISTGDTLWMLPYSLPPGKHTFKVVSTNSAGISSSENITINILDDESAIPQTWASQSIKDTLSMGVVLPLDNISAPASKKQLANVLSVLYIASMPEDVELPEYEEGVITDCGSDNYYPFLATNLEILSAENGIFNPYSTVTEREALLAMYASTTINPNVPSELSEDEIVKFMTELGVIEDAPQNVYTPDKPLTKELALHRVAVLAPIVLV